MRFQGFRFTSPGQFAVGISSRKERANLTSGRTFLNVNKDTGSFDFKSPLK